MIENATYSDLVMGRYRSEYNAKSFVATLATYSARYGLDVNFVENMRLVQEFTQLPTGEWVLTVDDMIVEMVLFDFLQKGVAIKTTRLSDYAFDEMPKQLFRGKVSYELRLTDSFVAKMREADRSAECLMAAS